MNKNTKKFILFTTAITSYFIPFTLAIGLFFNELRFIPQTSSGNFFTLMITISLLVLMLQLIIIIDKEDSE